MANNNYPYQYNQPVTDASPKKADLILERLDGLMGTMNGMAERIEKTAQNTAYLSRQSTEIFNRSEEDDATIKQQVKFIASQSQSVFDKLAEMITSLSERVDSLEKSVSGLLDSTQADDIVDRVNAHTESVLADYFGGEDEIPDQPSYVEEAEEEEIFDYEEMARKLSECMPQTTIDYDFLAYKIVTSMPETEVNEDALAAKVAEQVVPDYVKMAEEVASRLPETYEFYVDEPGCEALADAISKKLGNVGASGDFDVTIDEDGVKMIADEVSGSCGGRFDDVDEGIREIKDMLSGAVIKADDGSAGPAEEETLPNDAPQQWGAPEEESLEESEEIVTVSDIVDDEEYDDEDDEYYDEEGGPHGPDFAHMMRYKRSFIARIIQGSDQVKEYYGRTKTALLSYKKVNSNISWGSERFNKGRETIARIKVRGKTLCLYLNLNPGEYDTNIYHQTDVSDVKSVAGTPMMVKIKSPLGVKRGMRLIDEMLAKRGGEKQDIPERDYVAMYPYETIDELIEDGLVKDMQKIRENKERENKDN